MTAVQNDAGQAVERDATAIRDAEGGLAAFIYPTTVAQFAAEHWRRAPLVSTRDDAWYFAALPGLADIDLLLSTSLHGFVDNRGKLVRSQADGGYAEEPFHLRPDLRLDLHHVFARYADGYTIVLNLVEVASLAAARLCSALERDTGFRVSVNAYVTPPGSQGFGAHFDSHDVFVVQAEGTKTWRIGTRPDTESGPGLATTAQFLDYQDVTLRAGDSLYLPRGYAHRAHTVDESSVHYTFGLSAPTWSQVITDAVESRARQGAGLEEFAPLVLSPVAGDGGLGVTPDLHQVQLTEADLQVSLDAMGASLLDRHLTHHGQLASIDDSASLRGESVLKHVDSWVTKVEKTESASTLRYAGRIVDVPPHCSVILDHIVSHRQFRIDEVPGDHADVLTLCRTLIVEGFLTTR